MVTLKLNNSFILGATTKFYHRFGKLMRWRMQSTHRMYPTIKCFTLYSTIRQTTILDLLHFPGPKKLPKLVLLLDFIVRIRLLWGSILTKISFFFYVSLRRNSTPLFHPNRVDNSCMKCTPYDNSVANSISNDIVIGG